MSEKIISREALEFAPGLLSIQESPPSKLPRTVMYLVLLLAGLLIFWAMFGRLDIVASAEGRLLPESYVKIVQPADAGIIQDILVREGQVVHAGDILMRMDANTTVADAKSVESEMKIRALQLRRIDAELGVHPLDRQESDPADIYVQTVGQLQAHRLSYGDALAQEEQILQKAREDLHAAEEVRRKLDETLPVYQKNAEAFAKLEKQGFVSTMEAQDKLREKIEKEQDLRTQLATIRGLKAAISASEKKLAQIRSDYMSQLENERSEAQAQYKKLIQEWGKNIHKTTLLELKAPQDGVIKDLATHTRGTVVSPGTVLMSLVPKEDILQAEVMVKNEDVGFVHPGQHVKIKLVAYPFQKYGMIDGDVIYVGADASQGQSQSSALSTANTEKSDMSLLLIYKVLIHLHRQTLSVDGKRLKLTAGMQTVAEIHLGERTVMEYLLSPVQKAWQEAGRER